MVFLVVPIEGGKRLHGDWIVDDGPLIHDALGSKNVALVPIEAINCRLECLWDDILLQDDVHRAPLFEHV